jgi:hypothetical protein
VLPRLFKSRIQHNDFRQTVFKFFPLKAAELAGVAGGFCCLSLRRSKISKDL